MKRMLMLVALMLGASFAALGTDPSTINLGTLNLAPNTAGQTFDINVSGSDTTEGMNFYLQVGGGTAGPVISNVSLANASAIWGADAYQVELGSSDGRTVFHAVITKTAGGVTASGKVATITVDTTSIPGGEYAMKLKAVSGFDTELLNASGNPLSMSLTDGKLVVPYVIAASAGTGGSIDQSGDVPVNPGANKTFTFSAAPGYALSDVLVDGVSQGVIPSYEFTGVASNHTITANFAAVPLTIVKAADPVSVPEGSTAQVALTLSAQPAGDIVLGVAIAAGGDSDISITAGSSLTFTQENWNTPHYVTIAAAEDNSDKVNGSATLDVTKTSGTNAVAAATVTVNETDDDFTLTVIAGAGGSVTPSVARLVDSNNELPFAVVASALAGYQFANWTGDTGVLTDANSASTTVKAGTTADCTITATFTAVPLTIVKAADPVSVPEGDTAQVALTLSAQPAGDIVVGVAIAAGGDPSFSITGGSSLTFTQENWNTPHNVTVAAAEDNTDKVNGAATLNVTQTSGINTVAATTVVVNEVDDDFTLTVIALTGGSVTPTGDVLVDKNNALPYTVSATASPGYQFANWTDPSGVLTNAALASTSVKIGTAADCTITATFTALPPSIVSTRVFYNNSAWDNNDVAAGVEDDLAIATDKAVLLAGVTATFANYTSYGKGLNGIMVDVLNLPGTPDAAADFIFKTGNDNTPSGWSVTTAPTIATRDIGGNVTRVTLIWADNAIKKTWLQVTVKNTATTGLASPYVFYFGNAPGDCGNSATDAMVNATDQLAARSHGTGTGLALITDAYDYNRDKTVDDVDVVAARNSATSPVTMLNLIKP